VKINTRGDMRDRWSRWPASSRGTVPIQAIANGSRSRAVPAAALPAPAQTEHAEERSRPRRRVILARTPRGSRRGDHPTRKGTRAGWMPAVGRACGMIDRAGRRGCGHLEARMEEFLDSMSVQDLFESGGNTRGGGS